MRNINFSKKKAILFDLGGILIQYYERKEFPEILKVSIKEVSKFLKREKLLFPSKREIWRKVNEENYENQNFKVRSLENRLIQIFKINQSAICCSTKFRIEKLLKDMCVHFMKPIFSIAKIYNETYPTLRTLKNKGFKLVVISNTPWGSPADLWRKELKKYKFSKFLDLMIFCRDIKWRKPSEKIFSYTLNLLNLTPNKCIFIGDDPRWDLIGPRKVGMDALILDRKKDTILKNQELLIQDLTELLNFI